MTKTKRSARATALADQLEGAHAEARAQFATITEQLSGTVRPPEPDTSKQIILKKFATLAAAEGYRLCPHLDINAPQPAWWCPWAPRYLRCADCQLVAGEHFWESGQRQRCDVCSQGNDAPLTTLLMATAPLLVAPHGGEPIWSLFPVLIHYSLCEKCVNANEPHTTSSRRKTDHDSQSTGRSGRTS